jgi:3',5'-cyclic-AMP phosphodiesterase
MPIEWGGMNRRRFLAEVGAAGAVLLAGHAQAGAESNISTIALLSDTHIATDPTLRRGDVNMSEHFKAVREDLLACPTKPATVLINGDCAFLDGQEGDYRTLIEHLEPIRKGGRSIAMNLGNHDDRASFTRAFEGFHCPDSPVADKHATVIDAGPVRWFLLDSLEKVNDTPGTLGEKQLTWLDASLAKHSDKPALVMAHHNPHVLPMIEKGEVVVPVAKNHLPVPGLTDADRLVDVLGSHKHVTAYFYGHTHQWNVFRWEGIHFVNLPCVAYPFTPVDPAGWVLCQSQATHTDLELCSLDKTHPMHAQKVKLPHRGA